MSFPRFLVGMLGALAAFAIFTFAASQSLWTTVWQTLVCAVLIQIGYFGAVLVLVSRQKRGVSDNGSVVDQVAPQERGVEPLARVGRARRTLETSQARSRQLGRLDIPAMADCVYEAPPSSWR